MGGSSPVCTVSKHTGSGCDPELFRSPEPSTHQITSQRHHANVENGTETVCGQHWEERVSCSPDFGEKDTERSEDVKKKKKSKRHCSVEEEFLPNHENYIVSTKRKRKKKRDISRERESDEELPKEKPKKKKYTYRERESDESLSQEKHKKRRDISREREGDKGLLKEKPKKGKGTSEERESDKGLFKEKPKTGKGTSRERESNEGLSEEKLKKKHKKTVDDGPTSPSSDFEEARPAAMNDCPDGSSRDRSPEKHSKDKKKEQKESESSEEEEEEDTGDIPVDGSAKKKRRRRRKRRRKSRQDPPAGEGSEAVSNTQTPNNNNNNPNNNNNNPKQAELSAEQRMSLRKQVIPLLIKMFSHDKTHHGEKHIHFDSESESAAVAPARPMKAADPLRHVRADTAARPHEMSAGGGGGGAGGGDTPGRGDTNTTDVPETSSIVTAAAAGAAETAAGGEEKRESEIIQGTPSERMNGSPAPLAADHEPEASFSDVHGYKTVPPPPTYRRHYQPQRGKRARPADLLNGAQVFNRRNLKKSGFYSLSNNEGRPADNDKEESTEGENAAAENVSACNTGSKVTPAGPQKPLKDYSSMPPLHGMPRAGDKIAYKTLELSEDYTPQMSDFQEASVLAVDMNTKMIEVVMVTLPKVKERPGRFDLCTAEDDTSWRDTHADGREYLEFSTLLEVRLVPS